MPKFEDRTDLLISTDEWDVQPTQSFILLERVDDTELAGSIVVPDRAKDKFWPRWRVLATGPGQMTINGTLAPVGVKLGDMVVLQRTDLMPVPGRSRETVIAPEGSIVAIVCKRDSLQ